MTEKTVRGRPGVAAIGALAFLLFAVWPGYAQSITNGALDVTVRDSRGAPLQDAHVQITDARNGVSWSRVASRSGKVSLSLIPPGEYEVRVERLGYRPKRVVGVPVRPGRRRELSIRVSPAEPPVNDVETVAFGSTTVEGSGAIAGRWFSSRDIRHLPEQSRDLNELARLTSRSDSDLQTEGLPGWLSGVYVDGVPYAASRHPDVSTLAHPAAAFPLSALGFAELVTNGVDVEWSGHAGGYLSAFTRRGPGTLSGEAFGDWTGDGVTSSRFFDAGANSTNSIRSRALLAGPLVRDTAHFVLGVEFQNLETPTPRPFAIRALDSEVVQVAQESFGVDLSDHLRPGVVPTEMISAFGRYDWQFDSSHLLTARANFARFETGGEGAARPGLGHGQIGSPGSTVEGVDFSGAATLSSMLGRRWGQELRVGVETSRREYVASTLGSTVIVDGGLAFGADPAPPGEFDRTTLRGSESLHFRTGSHRLKLGATAWFSSFSQNRTFGRTGEFLFGGVDEFDQVQGVFTQAVSLTPMVEFSTWQLGAFVQDVWSAAPGLDVLFGLRYEYERLPRDEVDLNSAWRAATGVDNTDIPQGVHKFSPRFGFNWDIARRGEWFLSGGAGLYHDRVEPGLLGEVISQDASVDFRRAAGALGSWPAPPDSSVAPVVGSRLSLLSPDFEPPRSARASAGITRLLPSGTSVHLSGTYRHTDFLPRREDLNLPINPSARDQHGRPVFGTLIKQGGLLAAVPGTNRRFDGFDMVSALNSDGFSDYWGLTVGFEQNLTDYLDFFASYTYSKTTDNWLSGQAGGPEGQLSPFPGPDVGNNWLEGRSDFDVPHRVVVASEFRLPDLADGVRLATLYRFRSGYPFTPGFRTGVDANGDGSIRNDPAFVDPDVPGVQGLLREWDCLQEQVGSFAERNSCRGPVIHRLDVRLGIRIGYLAGQSLEVLIDGLNLLESDLGLRDGALYLVDPDAELVAAGGTVEIPLAANSRFGEPLTRRTSGRAVRFGLQVSF